MIKDDVTSAPQTAPSAPAETPGAAQAQQNPLDNHASSDKAPAAAHTLGDHQAATVKIAAKPARKTTITPGSRTPQKRAGATLHKPAIKNTRKIAPKTDKPIQIKDNAIMATQDKIKNDVNAVVADVQEFAKTAYAKGSQVTGEIGGFVKGNAEAVVASGKTLGEGLKDLGAGSLADSRKVIATVADDLKALAALKSPAELFELQGKIAGRNFEAALGYATKSSETLRNLATKAFAPISARVQANLEALRKAA